jgi:F420-dependent oxidoreductase-like protein
MRVGLQIPHFRPSTPENRRQWLTELAQTADQGGFDSLWFMDHFFQLGSWLGPAEDEMMEGYTLLGFVAGLTEKIHLGLMVGGVIYREPAVVVKMISTLDVLSGGRMYFGIGAAWYECESKALGLPFPPTRVRFELLEEQLQIAHAMFSSDQTPYEGKHTRLERPVNNPQPLQQPHPPILVGGMGPNKTLRLVAKYADACNFFGGYGDDQLRDRLEILKKRCEEIGRPYGEIEKTVLETIDLRAGRPDVATRGRHLHGMGFEHVIFNINGEYSPNNLRFLTEEVLPPLHAL